MSESRARAVTTLRTNMETDSIRTDATIPEKLDFILDRIRVLDTKIDPIIEAYDSVLLGKKFIVGIAGFVTVIVVLGGSIIWVGSYLKAHFF